MSLRDKTLLIILVTMLVMTIALYSVVRAVILHEVHRHEHREQLEEVRAALNVWKNLVDSLGVTTRDWAYWDDTWSFMETRDPLYVAATLGTESLANIDVDFILFLDTQGDPVFTRGLDRSSMEVSDLSETALDDIRGYRVLCDLEDDNETAGGLVFVEGRPAIVTSAAILTSARQGARRGGLIMGRFVNDEVISQMGRMMRHPIRALWPGTARFMQEREEVIELGRGEAGEQLVIPIGDAWALGYALVKDLNGEPALLLEVKMERSAHMAALMGLHTLLLAVLVVALTLALVVLLLLQRFVLKPIGALGAWARSVSSHRGAAGPVLAEGTDEVQALDRQIRALVSALHESEMRFRELAEMLPETVFETDMTGRFMFVNQTASKSWGYTKEEVIAGMSLFDVLIPADADRARENIRRRFMGERGANEYTGLRKDGSLFPLAIYSTVNYRDGKPVGLRGIAIDMTERAKMEELKIAKEAAERSSQLKTEFMANISHELRTPLNSIIGFAEAIRDGVYGTVSDKQSSAAEDIRVGGRHLLKLINDILDLSKIESGKVDLSPREISLAPVLEEVLSLFGETAEKNNLDFALELSDAARELVIEADELRFRQIVLNLLANAVKFTPDGGRITVSAEQAAEEVIIRVADTGIGVKAADRERIFEKFQQADASYARLHDGSGLGLALVREYVLMHGGRVWVESEGEGRGSTFVVVLPIARHGGRCLKPET